MKRCTFRFEGLQVKLHVDKQWIFSYSPTLSKTFSCNINLELCAPKLGGIKYLVNYVCKLRERITTQLQNETSRHDEINNFVKDSYVSASEQRGKY